MQVETNGCDEQSALGFVKVFITKNHPAQYGAGSLTGVKQHERIKTTSPAHLTSSRTERQRHVPAAEGKTPSSVLSPKQELRTSPKLSSHRTRSGVCSQQPFRYTRVSWGHPPSARIGGAKALHAVTGSLLMQSAQG